MIFFRDQFLTHEQQVAFGLRFGKLTYAHPHDDAPPEGQPEIYTVDHKRFEERYGEDYRKAMRRHYDQNIFSGWHTDVTAAVNPQAGSILRADVLPEIGGDTQWTNLAAAYEGLSEPVKKFAATCGPSTATAATGLTATTPWPGGSRTTCWWRSIPWCGSTP